MPAFNTTLKNSVSLCVYTRARARARARMRAWTHTYTHARTHAGNTHTHTHAHTVAHTVTHTHTRTHARSAISWLRNGWQASCNAVAQSALTSLNCFSCAWTRIEIYDVLVLVPAVVGHTYGARHMIHGPEGAQARATRRAGAGHIRRGP